jgi:hypothetical protein
MGYINIHKFLIADAEQGYLVCNAVLKLVSDIGNPLLLRLDCLCLVILIAYVAFLIRRATCFVT